MKLHHLDTFTTKNNNEIRKQAINTLNNLKVLIPFDSSLELYHGRTESEQEKYSIKNDVNNTGNYNGHYNVNGIPGLHTSTIQVAQLYANARTKEKYTRLINQHAIINAKPNIYRIVATTNSMYIFDICKIYNTPDLIEELSSFINLSEEEKKYLNNNLLSKEQTQQMKNAISALISTYTIPELVPHLFCDKQNSKILKDLIFISKQNSKQGKKQIVYDKDLEKYLTRCKSKNLDIKIIQKIANTINMYNMIKFDCDILTLFNKLQSGIDFNDECSLNLDLFKNFLISNNICGVHQKIWKSNVISLANFDDYFFFDTTKINTERVAKKIREENFITQQ